MTDVDLAKPYLVVLALYELGGEADLESISVKAYELFPNEFSWRSHPEYPDKDTVRVHLSDAKKEDFGELVRDRDLRAEGRQRQRIKRYALTEKGVEKSEQLLTNHSLDRIGASTTDIDYNRVIEPVLTSEAFQRFSSSGTFAGISREDFLSAFKLFPDASDVRITGRLSRVQKAVAELRDDNGREQLIQFIRTGREKFNV